MDTHGASQADRTADNTKQLIAGIRRSQKDLQGRLFGTDVKRFLVQFVRGIDANVDGVAFLVLLAFGGVGWEKQHLFLALLFNLAGLARSKASANANRDLHRKRDGSAKDVTCQCIKLRCNA